MECQILYKIEEIMLYLNRFRYNHHPSGVKMLAKFIRRGFSESKRKSKTNGKGNFDTCIPF